MRWNVVPPDYSLAFRGQSTIASRMFDTPLQCLAQNPRNPSAAIEAFAREETVPSDAQEDE